MITCKFNKDSKMWEAIDEKETVFFDHKGQAFAWQQCRIKARQTWQVAELKPRRKDGDYCTYTPSSAMDLPQRPIN